MCESDENGDRSFLALPGFAIMTTGSLGWLAGPALKAAVSRQREFLADARPVQFTRSREGLGGVLRKVAGERAGVGRRPGSTAHRLHPPLAERMRRIYGRPMPALPVRRDRPDNEAPTRPAALFQPDCPVALRRALHVPVATALLHPWPRLV